MALATAALLLHSGAVLAADGILNSVAFSKIPAGASFVLQGYDDSDATLTLKEDIANALTAAGYAVAEKGSFILNFETSDEIGAWSTTDRRHILSLQTGGGRGGGENAKARINVYDSSTGGLLNKGRGGGTAITTPSQYRIDVAIEDKASGKTLWQGWAVADLHGTDGLDLMRRMVPGLVGKIGQTVRQEPFSLY